MLRVWVYGVGFGAWGLGFMVYNTLVYYFNKHLNKKLQNHF